MAEPATIDPALIEFATDLKNDERFKEIVKALKAETLRDWAGTSSADMSRREELWRDIQAIGRVENRLQALVDNTKIAERKAKK